MSSSEIRKLFLDFFKERGHTIVPSSSLIPDDPSVLLTTAGMQQFKKYYTGELDSMKDFGSKSTASVQKSFRTSDIDEVGDETHLTFFEMLGNFSFGGYQKKDAITYAYDFITKAMNLPISYVTIFKGSDAVPKDEESRAIWQSLGVQDIREEGMEDVFWGPTGSAGPCGPTTEVYCKNADGRDVEIWNIVFNQFFYPGDRKELLSGVSDKKLEPLKIFGIDTGMGLERLAMIAQEKKNIFETDLFSALTAAVSGGVPDRVRRLVVDHMRAVAFLISDGVRPSNKGAGYVLRRLMRRAILHASQLGIDLSGILRLVADGYKGFYPGLDDTLVQREFLSEQERFEKTLKIGFREFKKMESVDAAAAFKLYESYGLPFEALKDFGGKRTENLRREDFDKELERHQEKSRAGAEKKFGGHGLLLDTGELKAANEEELKKVTRLHTATHLMQQALRDVLGNEVHQAGSDITAERARFDFSYPRKLTAEEIKKVEDIINQKIKEDLPMTYEEMSKDEAAKTGALHFFREKYPEKVKVYYAGKSLEDAYSKEFCGGPHVTHTGEIGKFKILKEEAVSAGVRRIRAAVE